MKDIKPSRTLGNANNQRHAQEFQVCLHVQEEHFFVLDNHNSHQSVLAKNQQIKTEIKS